MLLAPLAAVAQYDNGSLLGTIRDTTGAPIAGAQVTVTNLATGLTATLATNGTGDYEFPNLRVGTYKLNASAASFSNAIADKLNVTVGRPPAHRPEPEGRRHRDHG